MCKSAVPFLDRMGLHGTSFMVTKASIIYFYFYLPTGQFDKRCNICLSLDVHLCWHHGKKNDQNKVVDYHEQPRIFTKIQTS